MTKSSCFKGIFRSCRPQPKCNRPTELAQKHLARICNCSTDIIEPIHSKFRYAALFIMPTGSCFCGAVRYSYEGEPIAKAVCHCTDCRKMSGSTYSTNVIASGEGFKLIAGTPKKYTVKADSGASPTNFFCGDCGSICWRETETFGNNKIIKAGTLDDISALDDNKPVLELYTKHRVSWVSPVQGADQKKGMTE